MTEVEISPFLALLLSNNPSKILWYLVLLLWQLLGLAMCLVVAMSWTLLDFVALALVQ